jgi:hypothetical protein
MIHNFGISKILAIFGKINVLKAFKIFTPFVDVEDYALEHKST